MKLLLTALGGIAAGTLLLADQHRQKVESGDPNVWFDWNGRAPTSALARDTIWSHDAWAFGLGVVLPVAVTTAAVARRM